MANIDHIKDAVVKIITGLTTGSGMYYKELGAVITNHHVVAGERQVAVALQDGTKQLGSVFLVSPRKDLAFISIPGPVDKLPSILLQDKKVKQQERVFALGYPFDLPFTVTEGIVSSPEHLNRDVKYIQTDAALNPGNSGGPLVNAEGEIVGVNTQVMKDASNVGFALPVEYVVHEISLQKEENLARDRYQVRCTSCDGLILKETEFCDNCGAKINVRQLFQVRPLSPLEQFVESHLPQLGMNPILGRKGMPEYWEFYAGSAQIRIFTYRHDFLFSTSPLARLPKKNLQDVYRYILSNPLAPYMLGISGDVIYLSHRFHLSDLIIKDYRKPIGDQIVNLATKANEVDDYLVSTFGCEWAPQSKKSAAHEISF